VKTVRGDIPVYPHKTVKKHTYFVISENTLQEKPSNRLAQITVRIVPSNEPRQRKGPADGNTGGLLSSVCVCVCGRWGLGSSTVINEY
jgi:hypothetical protein